MKITLVPMEPQQRKFNMQLWVSRDGQLLLTEHIKFVT